MKWYSEFEADLKLVFAEAETIISKFPQPLNLAGLTYLNSFNVFKADSHNNYICYLLPFWLRGILPVDYEISRKLSLANIFGMLYFFIQDDQIDSSCPDRRTQLPLANLLHIEFIHIYQQLFPITSPFWTYYSTYITTWAEAIVNEEHMMDFKNNPVQLAHKASPIKLSSAGICLLAQQRELIPIVSTAVDHVLITLQMADDWADWQDDYQEGNYNSLIDLIHCTEQSTNTPKPLSITLIKEYIYMKDILKLYVQTALQQQEQLFALDIPIPHLVTFDDSIVQYLLGEAARIEQERETLTQGGFDHWLSKMI